MNFFDYMYCRLYWWNTKIIKEKETPTFYSIVGLSVFQSFGIIPIIDICGIFIGNSTYINAVLSISHFYLVLGIIVLIVDLIYYNKKKRKKLYTTFANLTVDKKKKLDILCLSYILIIIVSNILLSIYMRFRYEG